MNLKEIILDLLVKIGMFTAKSSAKSACKKSVEEKAPEVKCETKCAASEEKKTTKTPKAPKASSEKKAPLPRKKP